MHKPIYTAPVITEYEILLRFQEITEQNRIRWDAELKAANALLESVAGLASYDAIRTEVLERLSQIHLSLFGCTLSFHEEGRLIQRQDIVPDYCSVPVYAQSFLPKDWKP